MLTKLLLQDETTASLGKKTEHISGRKFDLHEMIGQCVIQEVEEQNTPKLVRKDFFTFLKIPRIRG